MSATFPSMENCRKTCLMDFGHSCTCPMLQCAVFSEYEMLMMMMMLMNDDDDDADADDDRVAEAATTDADNALHR